MQRKRPLAALLATLCAALAALLTSAPATAAPDTVYCLNGMATTLPASVSASSVTAGSNSFVLDEIIALAFINNHGGSFAFGYFPGNSPLPPHWYIVVSGSPISAADLEPGFTTNQIAVGPCTSAAGAAPAVTHLGVCKWLKRGDGTMGLFQEITVANWNDKEGQYFDAPAANWVEGLGLTCDNPVALGYKPAGYNVAWGGKRDPGHDPGGVRASGFNNIYPYFEK